MEKLHADLRMKKPSEELKGLFWRAVQWFMEYEEWGEAAFPNESRQIQEQPWEWVRSVEAVKAARAHFQAHMKSSPEEQMQSEEGGIGRGAVGDSL